MKAILLLAWFSFLGFTAYNQNSNLVFYTENGERFYVILNGIRQNQEAETNVKITDLNQPYYKAKIIFEDENLGEFDKAVNFNPGTETVLVIKQNRKGNYVLRWQSEVPVAQAAPPAANQKVIMIASTPPPAQATITSTETTTTTVSGGTDQPGNAASVGVSVNDGGVGLNMNVSINEGNQTQISQTTYSSTTTTTTTTGGAAPDPGQDVYVMQGYNGPVGCPWPIEENDFDQARRSISGKSFDDSRLTMAKQIINSNCLFSSQVRDIMTLFSFEETKLELAKFAYGHTFDIGNYYKVNDAFDFEMSIEELNEYIGTR